MKTEAPIISSNGESYDSLPDIPNPGSDAVQYFAPVQTTPAGTAISPDPPTLFQPLRIRDLTLQNRIFLSPMAQASSDDGHATDWHLAHLGGIITRGPGLSFVEGTAVLPTGRTTPQDSGLWKDSQIEPLRRIVAFTHSQGQKIGLQLAHGGRKSPAVAPWVAMPAVSSARVGGWPGDTWAPSAIPFGKLPTPQEMTIEDIAALREAWGSSTRRAVSAGFDVLEIHAGHGYLVHEFLSPVTNKRTDRYGGSLENRARLLAEVVEVMRANMPSGMPLFVRVSATDWLDEVEPTWQSWNVDETVELAHMFKGKIDLLDVSSGGLHPLQHIHTGSVAIGGKEVSAYQAPFALKVKQAVGSELLVSAVGAIGDGHTAQYLLDQGLDAVFVAKAFLKNPGLVFKFGEELGVDVKMPGQMSWAFKGRGKK